MLSVEKVDLSMAVFVAVSLPMYPISPAESKQFFYFTDENKSEPFIERESCRGLSTSSCASQFPNCCLQLAKLAF